MFEGRKIDPPQALNKIMSQLNEFEMAQECEATTQEAHDPRDLNLVWYPARDGMTKLNTDAALAKQGKVGKGMVVRDLGDILMVAGERARNTEEEEALEAEAVALLFGLHLAFEAGFRRVEAEVDCSKLVALILGKTLLALLW